MTFQHVLIGQMKHVPGPVFVVSPVLTVVAAVWAGAHVVEDTRNVYRWSRAKYLAWKAKRPNQGRRDEPGMSASA